MQRVVLGYSPLGIREINVGAKFNDFPNWFLLTTKEDIEALVQMTKP